MHITILGRQPEISIAELERVFGSNSVRWFSSDTATVDTPSISIEKLGGSLKAGKVVLDLPKGNWRQVSDRIIHEYTKKWQSHAGKITLGISLYGFNENTRDIQKTGLILKKELKRSGVSLRLIPNAEPALSTATSHHNKLGLSPNKVELLVVRGRSGGTLVAESTGSQNITALARRDQGRPKRDAFVGMLPPKLALLMTNLADGNRWTANSTETSAQARESSRRDSWRNEDCLSEASSAVSQETSKRDSLSAEAVSAEFSRSSVDNSPRLLDPFCGTGVVLQEAALIGYAVYGTDLSEKMVAYSQANLSWLEESHRLKINLLLQQGDAMKHTWQQPIDLVVSETYLGQPFSAPPSPKKLEEVRGNVNHITSSFLKNLYPQIKSGTQLCLAVPAWRGADGHITHLPLTRSLDDLGYRRVKFNNVTDSDLIYYREDQVVARELLVLERS